MSTSMSTLTPRHRGLRAVAAVAVVGVLAGLATVLAPAPAFANLGAVCRLQATFHIAGDDVRGNTSIQIAAGGSSFIVAGGIPSNTVATRTGTFPGCVPDSALGNGFTITSISNPSWPETTDNWDLAGLSLTDPDTGRRYVTMPSGASLIHRFTGQQPTFQTPPVVVDESSPFFDTRYSDCAGSSAFVRFVDPRNLSHPTFTVTMHRVGASSPTVPASPWGPPFNDWGGSVSGLGISVASAAFIAFDARTPDGRLAADFLSPGCNPNAV